MKNRAIKVIRLVATALILPWLASSQQPTQSQHQIIWGAISNGVCAGISAEPSGWPQKNDYNCSIELGNMTTNLLWVWFPSFEQRYEIQLLGPDGNRIRQLKPLFHSLHTKWSSLKPLSTNYTSGSFDWCLIKDAFDVRTNGQFTLIASMRVNVFTSFTSGQAQMLNNPTYSLLPPVTNMIIFSSPVQR